MAGAGVIVDMVTPMAAGGELDLRGAVRLSRSLRAAGVDGIVLSAEAGEGEALDADERLALWETVAAALGGELPIWGGLWGANGRSASRLGGAAAALGLAGVAVPIGGGARQGGLRLRQALGAADTGAATVLAFVPGGQAV
jgi:dihydrodipicolinate synthase/N-acetylneuraminate lyase